MEKVVIFGAGSGAAKVVKTLKSVGVQLYAATDNNPAKWGTEFCGLQVIAPEELKNMDCKIIIASVYQNEIEVQLEQYGILDRVEVKEQYIEKYVEQHLDEFEYLRTMKVDKSREREIVMGLDYGTELGGIETLAFMWTKELRKREKKVNILTIKTESDVPEDLKDCVEYYHEDFECYWDTLKQVVDKLSQHLPCVLIDNWEGLVLMAASVIKRFRPDDIRVVSVIHNDRSFLYKRAAYMEKYTDAIAGVSKKIIDCMHSEYGVEENKLFYQASPIEYDESVERTYTTDPDKELRIGYAARIFKSQKRADLLVPLMLQMNKDHINYHLYIAGDGEYFEKLQEEVKRHNLQDKCTLHGRIPREEIKKFWLDKDVFINLSDYEGVGLSMLEAMACGVVPVETEVAGCYEFIKQGENGYVVPLQDIEAMSKYIGELALNRERLPLMGEMNRKIIQRDCNKDNYIDYLLKLCQSV